MKEMVQLKHENAMIMGNFDSHTHLKLDGRMATAEEAYAMLEGLAESARPFAVKERADLVEFATHHNITNPRRWDEDYLEQKMQKEKYYTLITN